MPYIKITVRDKVATGDRSRIVCGNSDYIAIFDFDAEWDPYDTKTARFVYAEHSGQYVDVVFTGTECPVPVIQDVIGVTVGVFAGDLHTTTPAWFECDKSILCGGGSPAAPPDDVYNQIMELIHGLGTPDEKTIAAAVADYILAHPIQESDPTVPDWAKEGTKPSYTAAEVGADPSGTAAARVSEHNTETTAHSDMRLLIQGLTDRLNALADSDDTTLDQLSEIVAYIKSNRDLISAVTTDKVSVSDIVDNLTTNVATAPLSAAQGVALKALIDAITIPTALPNPNALTFTGAVSGSYDGSAPLEVEIPSGGAGLTVTNTAAVGQTVKITAVDENGQPTEWEAVDMPSGGGGTTSDEWIDLGTLTLADGEEATNFSWKVNGQVKKIHIEGEYYSATSGKNLSVLNTDTFYGNQPLITYNFFRFPPSAERAMYMDLTVEELYPGYWFGVGGASTFNNPHENTLASYGSAKRVDSYLSLGEYWRNTPLTAGTWFNVKVVYY